MACRMHQFTSAGVTWVKAMKENVPLAGDAVNRARGQSCQ